MIPNTNLIKWGGGGGAALHKGCFQTQLPRVWFPDFTEEKIADAAEVNQLCCYEESGQRLENVDWTLLILASGKIVLQNKIDEICIFKNNVNRKQPGYS